MAVISVDVVVLSIYRLFTMFRFHCGQWPMVWRLRGNIIRTALCWIVWHNVHSPQHTYMSSSYRSNRLGLSPYTVCRGGCLELYYCNMVEWFWWDSDLILTTSWFPSVLWHIGLVIWPVKIVLEMTCDVLSGTLSLYNTTTTVSLCRQWAVWHINIYSACKWSGKAR